MVSSTATEPAWLAGARDAARATYETLPVPTNRDEAWREIAEAIRAAVEGRGQAPRRRTTSRRAASSWGATTSYAPSRAPSAATAAQR